MSAWPTVKVRAVSRQIRGVSYSKDEASPEPRPGYIQLLRANNITDTGLIFDDVIFVPPSRVNCDQHLRQGDVVIAASSGSLDVVGKAGKVDAPNRGTFGAFCKVLRPSEAMDNNYFAHFFKTRYYRRKISSLAAGANINNLRNEHLDDLEIPLPPLPEQRRIAAILDEADALRAKRRAALAQLDEMAQAIFVEMFGDPVENRKGLKTTPLGTVASIQSGSTPSKDRPEYWGAGLPWVSPKDMKSHRIVDSIDHVTQHALDSGGLKIVQAGAVLIVVRGMILAHTVPIAIADRQITINQDMKALVFGPKILPEFGLWCLRVQQYDILEEIATASHGTKRLDTDRLLKRPILVPSLDEQQAFVGAVSEWGMLLVRMRKQLAMADSLFTSLQHRAFRGEL